MAIEICELPPLQWPVYRQLRLEALKLEPQAFGSSYESMALKPDQYFEDRLRQVEREQGNRLLFAMCDSRLVGMIGSARIGQSTEHAVNAFYVRLADRGHGIGKALLSALLTRIAADPDAETVTLHVNKSQPDAISLYESAGFQPISESQDQMGDGQTHPLVLMSLQLLP